MPSNRSMPRQKPGKSEQDVGTPLWLLRNVEQTYGPIVYDPAASDRYHACPNYDTIETDGLSRYWFDRTGSSAYRGIVWINPPFGNIRQWVEKAYRMARIGMTIVMLVPASVGSNWWRYWVHNKAAIRFLKRFRFRGHPQVYPKDCALLVYGHHQYSAGYDYLAWKEPKHDLDYKAPEPVEQQGQAGSDPEPGVSNAISP